MGGAYHMTVVRYWREIKCHEPSEEAEKAQLQLAMAHQLEVQEALRSLTISDTPAEWTNQVWEQNFCEGVNLPLQLETKNILNEANWSRLVKATRGWLQGKRRADSEDGEFMRSAIIYAAAKISYEACFSSVHVPMLQ